MATVNFLCNLQASEPKISLCPAASPKQFINSSIKSLALAMRLCQEVLPEQFWCRLYLHSIASLMIPGALHLTNKTHKVTMHFEHTKRWYGMA